MWSKISQILYNDQWGKDTLRLVEGDEAMFMIRRAERILEDSMRVLASHERVLGEHEFRTFGIKHRQLLLKVVEVKRQAHEQQTQSIFSASPVGRDLDRVGRNVFRIFKETQIYHQDLLTASQRAQIEEEDRFLKRHQAGPSQTGSIDPETTWYSIVSPRSSIGTPSVGGEAEGLGRDLCRPRFFDVSR
ncbi:unnamed protein product [Rhizoctonia solani]|uniref:Uncharacterized protein n=1 Tax=Rhizoctonia solani TaxID=456999 RepID=A0A8H3H9C0_9AGAM|nr:unnamed protein product [Rhizoctonia solani]